MTYENCLKYMNEAKEDKMKLFWNERIKRKYPDKVVAEEKKVSEKPSKPVKKVTKEVVKE